MKPAAGTPSLILDIVCALAAIVAAFILFGLAMSATEEGQITVIAIAVVVMSALVVGSLVMKSKSLKIYSALVSFDFGVFAATALLLVWPAATRASPGLWFAAVVAALAAARRGLCLWFHFHEENEV